MSSKKLVHDFVLYVPIALAWVGLVLLYTIYVPSSAQIEVRWFGLAGATAVTFGYPLNWYRRYLRNAAFWFAFVLLLLGHLLVYSAVLLWSQSWPLILFAVIIPVEWEVLCPLLERASTSARFRKVGELLGRRESGTR